MPLYAAYRQPKGAAVKENGATPFVSAVDAPNLKLANAKLTLSFAEAFPDADGHYFDIKIYQHKEGLPLPELNVWSSSFLNDYEWNNELKHLIPKVVEDAVIADAQNSDFVGAVGFVDYDSLSPELRNAVLVKYNTTNVTKEQLSAAFDIIHEPGFGGHLVEALMKTPDAAEMTAVQKIGLIADIRKNVPFSAKWPDIKIYIQQRINGHKTETGAYAGGNVPTDRGEGFEHNFDSLALDIALGRVARSMDFDIYDLRSGVVNRAREIIKLKEKPFPTWLDHMRKMPGILNYSRAMIIYAVKTAPDDIHAIPGALQDYLNRILTETDHLNPDPEIVAIACGIKQVQHSTEDPINETESAAPGDGSDQAEESKLDQTVAAESADNKAPAPLESSAQVTIGKAANGMFTVEGLTASNQVEKKEEPDNDFVREEIAEAVEIPKPTITVKERPASEMDSECALKIALEAIRAIRYHASINHVETIDYRTIGELIRVAGGVGYGV